MTIADCIAEYKFAINCDGEFLKSIPTYSYYKWESGSKNFDELIGEFIVLDDENRTFYKEYKSELRRLFYFINSDW